MHCCCCSFLPIDDARTLGQCGFLRHSLLFPSQRYPKLQTLVFLINAFLFTLSLLGDARTARDSRAFLLGWLQRFPQYAAADLHIAGESYGGHYVPQLAWEIWRGNNQDAATAGGGGREKTELRTAAAEGRVETAAADRAEKAAAAAGGAGKERTAAAGEKERHLTETGEAAAGGLSQGFINLKGIFVGNAWTDTVTDNKGALDFWYTHAMISDESYRGIKSLCDFAVIGPLFRGREAVTLPGTYSSSNSSSSKGGVLAAAAAGGGGGGGGGVGGRGKVGAEPTCDDWLEQASNEQGDINIYEIYADVCVGKEGKDSEGMAAAAAAGGGVGGGGSSSSGKGRYRGALLGWEKCGTAKADEQTDETTAAAADGGGGGGGGVEQKQQQQAPWFKRGLLASGFKGWPLSKGFAGMAAKGSKGAGEEREGVEGLARPHHGRPPRYDPCVDNEVEIYMNLPEVGFRAWSLGFKS